MTMKTTYNILRPFSAFSTAALAIVWMACATACSDHDLSDDGASHALDEWSSLLAGGGGAMSYDVASYIGNWQYGNPTRAAVGDGSDGYDAGSFGTGREFRVYANYDKGGQTEWFIKPETEAFEEGPVYYERSDFNRPEANKFPGVAGSESNVVRYYNEQGAYYNANLDSYVKTADGYFQKEYEYETDPETGRQVLKTDANGNYVYILTPKEPSHALEGVWHSRKIYYWPIAAGDANGENTIATFFAYYPKQATFSTADSKLTFQRADLGTGSIVAENTVDKVTAVNANTSSSTMADKPAQSITIDNDPRHIDGKTDVLYCLRHQTAYTNRNMSTNLSRYPAQIHFLHALSRIAVKANLSEGTSGKDPVADEEGGYSSSNWRVVITDVRFCNLREADSFTFAEDMSKDTQQSTTDGPGGPNVGVWGKQNTEYADDDDWRHNEWQATLNGSMNAILNSQDPSTLNVNDEVKPRISFTKKTSFKGVSIDTTTPVAVTASAQGNDLLLLPQLIQPWAQDEVLQHFASNSSYTHDTDGNSTVTDNPSLRPDTKGAYIAVTCRIYDSKGTPTDYTDDIDRFQADRTFYIPMGGQLYENSTTTTPTENQDVSYIYLPSGSYTSEEAHTYLAGLQAADENQKTVTTVGPEITTDSSSGVITSVTTVTTTTTDFTLSLATDESTVSGQEHSKLDWCITKTVTTKVVTTTVTSTPRAANDGILQWEPGKQYTYTLTFDGGSGWDVYGSHSIAPVSLTTTVSDWEDTDNLSGDAEQQYNN